VVSLWHFHKYLQCTLSRLTPSINFPHLLSPLLKIISSFIFQFSCKYIQYTNHIQPPSHSLFTLSPPTGTYLQTGPDLHSCSSFFKCTFIVQRGFTVIFHTWIYCTLIRLTISMNIFIFPCPPIIPQLSVHFIMPSSYTGATYFSIIHLLIIPFSSLTNP
jgi:hypothetical protein